MSLELQLLEPPEARHLYSRPGDRHWLVHLFHRWLCGVLCPSYTALVLGLAKSGRFLSSHRFLISSRCVSEMPPCGIALGAHEGGSGSWYLLQSAYSTNSLGKLGQRPFPKEVLNQTRSPPRESSGYLEHDWHSEQTITIKPTSLPLPTASRQHNSDGDDDGDDNDGGHLWGIPFGAIEEKKHMNTCISEYKALWKSYLKRKEASCTQYRKGRGHF